MSKEVLAIIIVVVVIIFIIGNFSTVHKTSKKPLRKKGLNDLKETLPRTNKKPTKLPTYGKRMDNKEESTSD